VASTNNGSKATLAAAKKPAASSRPGFAVLDSAKVIPAPAVALDQVDAAVSNDIRYVTDYVNDIYCNYLKAEPKHLPSENFMSIQTDVTPRMRAILIDWIVEVHLKFKLQTQTLYIAANVLDRFLEHRVVVRDELQLIGCTALWMASKMEEIYAPEVQDFVLISDRAFKRSDLLAMEGQMLNVLGFTMTFPTHYVFLTRWTRMGNADKKQKLLASYCVERTLQEYAFLKYKPSLVAAAGLLVAMESSPAEGVPASPAGASVWTPLLEKHTTYKEVQLQACAKDIRDLIIDAENRSLLAVRKKYLTEEHCFVARIPVHKA
jgi:hypothetical protein